MSHKSFVIYSSIHCSRPEEDDSGTSGIHDVTHQPVGVYCQQHHQWFSGQGQPYGLLMECSLPASITAANPPECERIGWSYGYFSGRFVILFLFFRSF